MATKVRTNADFRKIMMTPKPRRNLDEDDTADRYDRFRKMRPSTAFEKPKNQEKKRKRKKWRPRQDRTDNGKYRDRAKERRSGENPDYEDVEEDALTTSFQSVAPPSEDAMSVEAERQRKIEQSKYLGGDMKHTHLVKGLDFALLNRVKEEIAAKEQAKKKEQKEAEVEEKVEVGVTKKFRSTLGRNVNNLLFGEQSSYSVGDKNKQGVQQVQVVSAKKVVDTFLKGRTTFLFDLEGHFSQGELPTTLVRSKEDCPLIASKTTARLHPDILDRITKIMSYLKPSTGKVKKKKSRKRRRDSKGKRVEEQEEEVEEKESMSEIMSKKESVVSFGFIKPGEQKKTTENKHDIILESILASSNTTDDGIFSEAGSDYVCVPTKRQEEELKRKEKEYMEKLEREQQEVIDRQKKDKLDKESRKQKKRKRKEETQQQKTLHQREVEALAKKNVASETSYFGGSIAPIKLNARPTKRQKTEEIDLTEELEKEVSKEKKKAEGMQSQHPPQQEPAPGPVMPPASYAPYPAAVPQMPYPQNNMGYYYPNTDMQYQMYPQAHELMPPPPAQTQQRGVIIAGDKPMTQQQERDRGISTVFKRDPKLDSRKETDEREKDPSFVSESYTECYPGAYESSFLNTVVDDDSDDEDLTKMDMGTRARKKVRPWHFDTDAAWSKYNDQLEATPKAAFQFGVKMADGRKKGSLKKKKRTEQQKIHQQLQQLNKYMKDKKIK